MSDNNYTRQAAKRVLATELNSAHTTHKFEDGDRAPQFLILPSGDAANRVSIAGVVTSVADVGTDNKYLRAKVVGMAGGEFWVYAGQYEPNAMNRLEEMDAPEFISVIGKPRTFEKDNGDVNVSIRPEQVREIDAETRNRVVFDAIQHTIGRLKGEHGDERGQEMSEALYTDGVREQILEDTIEVAEELDAEISMAEPDEGVLSREELEAMDYPELQGLASDAEGISGNASAADIVDALAGQPA